MPQTKKTTPTIETAKKYRQTFLGILIYLLMVIVIVWISPTIILKWVAKSSSNPVITLWLVGMFLSSVIYGLVKLGGGMKITLFNINFDMAFKEIAQFFSLPYPAIGISLLFGLVGIILTRPLCQPPVVVVTATSKNGDLKSMSPGETFNTALDSSAVFSANALNSAVIVCQWDYVGKAILSLEPRNGCVVRITFSQEQDEIAVVTLNTTDSQCSQRNVFPFNVVIK